MSKGCRCILTLVFVAMASCAYSLELGPHLSGATLSLNKTSALANGTDIVDVSVQLSFANGAQSANYVVAFQAPDANGVVFSPSSVVTDANGRAHATMTSTVAATVKVSAVLTLGGSRVMTPAQSVRFDALPTPVSTAVATLAFTTSPQNANAGHMLAPGITVTALDIAGRPASAQIALTLSNTSVALHGTLNRETSNGMATFTDLAVETKGVYQLVATSGSISTPSTAFAIFSSAPASLEFATEPTDVVAGSPFVADIAVVDAYGNLVDTSTFVSVSYQSTLLSTGSDIGLITFPGLVVTRADPAATLVVSSQGLSSVSSTPFSVSAASPNHLIFGQQPSSTNAGNAMSPNIVVVIVDAYGNIAASNAAVTLQRSDATLEPAAAANATSGQATFTHYTPFVAGDHAVLQATSSGLAPISSRTFTVNPSAPSATQSTFTASPNIIDADNTQTSSLTVTLRDAYGNACPGLAITFSTSGTNVTLTPTFTNTASTGQATTALTTTTGQTLNANASSAGFTQTTSVKANAVLAPGLSTFSVSPTSAQANSKVVVSLTFSAKAYDGSAFPGQAVTFVSVGAGARVSPSQTFTSSTGAAAAVATSSTTGAVTFSAKANGYTWSQGANFTVPAACTPPGGTLMFPSVPAVALPATPTSAALGVFDGNMLSIVVASNNPNFRIYHNLGRGIFAAGAATNYPATSNVTTVLPMYYDSDTLQDLALVSSSAQTLAIRIGSGLAVNANNLFSVPTSAAPGPVVSADFNGDGFNDIAIGYGNGSVGVFVNSGGTNSAAGVNYPAGTASVTAMVAGDINGDGSIDLVFLQQAAATLTSMTNSGSGSFTQRSATPTSATSTVIAGGYLNQDGFFDVAVGDATTAHVFTGSATSLTPGTAYPVAGGGGASGIVVADFNGDGNSDIASGSPLGVLSIVLNPGYPTLSGIVSSVFNGNTAMLLTGDIDADSHGDLVVINSGANVFAPYLGAGDGTMRVATTYSTAAPVNALAVGDFNNDGNSDVVAAMSNGNITMFQGRGDGTLNHVAADVNTVAGASITSTVYADFNGDGKNDLALTLQNTNQIAVLLGKGDGTFVKPLTYLSTPSPTKILSGLFGSDTHIDMAVTNQNTNQVSIFSGAGDGNFTLTSSLSTNGNAPVGLNTGDFNADGFQDLVVVNANSNTLAYLRGSSSGAFSFISSTSIAVLQPQFVAVADFNADGKLDLAITSSNANVIIMQGSGTGTFSAPTWSTVTSSPAQKVAAQDVNADGYVDLVVVSTTAQGFGINIYLNNPSSPGSLYSGTYQPVGNFPGPFNVANVNSDSDLDFVVGLRSATTPGIVVMLQGGCAQ